MAPIDGNFDAGDDTGHARIDVMLDAFARANHGNPKAIAALEQLAAHAKAHPDAFDASGTLDLKRLADAILRAFANVTAVEVPSAELGSMADGDIMALAFLVLMEAAKSAREDLRAIMEGVKSINEQKAAWRQVQATIDRMAAGLRDAARDDEALPRGAASSLRWQPAGTAIRAGDQLLISTPDHPLAVRWPPDLTAARATIKHKLDSMSEMGEMESLRLQMAMDRLSKMMSALSNIMKKTHDTAAAIISNLK